MGKKWELYCPIQHFANAYYIFIWMCVGAFDVHELRTYYYARITFMMCFFSLFTMDYIFTSFSLSSFFVCLVQHRQLLNAIMQSYYNLMLAQRIMFYVWRRWICVVFVCSTGAYTRQHNTQWPLQNRYENYGNYFISILCMCVFGHRLEPHRKSPA